MFNQINTFRLNCTLMRLITITAVCLILCTETVFAQQLTSKKILEQSIKFHDPNGEWPTLKAELTFSETRPGGPDRKSVAQIDNGQSFFALNRNDEQIYQVDRDSCTIVKGEADCERATMMRNYYTYLWGLPMKLKDPGTELDEQYTEETLEGVACYVLRVPYEKDIWYFYMRKDNYAMVAYKFYKDEAAGKGEFIPTAGLFELGTMKIPNTRTWYRLPENEVLGTDILKSVK